jgi:hypothetical protein
LPLLSSNFQHPLDHSSISYFFNSFYQALAAETGLHDQADEEIDRLGIPVGWRECPMMGRPIFRFIPMKVPLGAHFDKVLVPKDRFTVDDAINMAQAKVNGIVIDVPAPPENEESEPTIERRPAIVNMVIDLTNSSRYYRKENFEADGFIHVKVSKRFKKESNKRLRIHFSFITLVFPSILASNTPFYLIPPCFLLLSV